VHYDNENNIYPTYLAKLANYIIKIIQIISNINITYSKLNTLRNIHQWSDFGEFMKLIHILLLVVFLMICTTQASVSFADSELALFEEIPIVFTPTKKAQPITQSPAAVYIITQEDIKQSGSIHLWDVLREVPGMDVVTSTVGQPDVSMRGFADFLTSKTLLLVDGRSVYLPAQGHILWEMLPVQLEEIERIEVVKGPVASLYGANANLGLINIITKTPENLDGGIISVTGGTRNTKRLSMMYGGKHNSIFYKFSTGWKDTDSFDDRDKDGLDVVTGNAFLRHEIDDDTFISISGGIAQGG